MDSMRWVLNLSCAREECACAKILEGFGAAAREYVLVSRQSRLSYLRMITVIRVLFPFAWHVWKRVRRRNVWASNPLLVILGTNRNAVPSLLSSGHVRSYNGIITLQHT